MRTGHAHRQLMRVAGDVSSASTDNVLLHISTESW
jgi:hypothetical protein